MKIKLLLVCALMISQILTAQDFRFGKVSKEELLEKSHPLDSTADAAILYRELKTNFEYSKAKGFYIVTQVFERIKIYNKKGFDWANKKIKLNQASSGSSDEELLRLKAITYYLSENDDIEEEKLRSDGIFEKEVSDYLETQSFTMPNVSEGCVIEYEYEIHSPFISNIDTYRLQEEIPINKVHIRFAAPEYFTYKPYQKGWIPFQIKNSKTNKEISFGYNNQVEYKELVYEVSLAHVPALKEEAYASNIDNYTSCLEFELSYTQFPNSIVETYATTWEAVCKTIYEADNFGDQLSKTSYFKKDLDALLAGIDPQKKMIDIFEFVKQKMNWNSYFGYHSQKEGVREAYKNGIGNSGDINLMLTAMFRYAGFDANPVLVSTKSNGIPIFPTRTGFNYVLSGVKKDGAIILFDATNKFGKPNVLEREIMNWQGRLVRKDGSSTWVSLMPTTQAVRNTMISVDLTPSFQIIGSSKNRFTGHYAMSFRKRYNDLQGDVLRKKLEEGKQETELSEIAFQNLLDHVYKPLNLSYDFETFNAISKIENKIYFSPMLFTAMKENPFKLEKRSYPIDYGFPMKDIYNFTISIPEGYKVASMPGNILLKMGEGIGSFKYLISNKGKFIQLLVEFSIEKPVVVASKYGSLKNFYKLLIAKEKEKIVLVKI